MFETAIEVRVKHDSLVVPHYDSHNSARPRKGAISKTAYRVPGVHGIGTPLSVRRRQYSHLEQALRFVLPFHDILDWNITGVGVNDTFSIPDVGGAVIAQFPIPIN
jgi:hypothetical protein